MLTFLFILAGASEWSDSGEFVTLLNDENFDEFRETHPKMFAMFFAPWCGHCKAMKADYAKAAEDLSLRIPLVAVDCTENKATCSRFQVTGFPTLKFFESSSDEGIDYNEGRSANDIVKFVEKRVPNDNLEGVDLEKLKIKTLKKILATRGVACSGCTERKEFVARVKEALTLPIPEKPKPAKKSGSGMTLMEERRYKEAKRVAEAGWGDDNGVVVHLIEQDFEQYRKDHEAFVVMFYAPWCGHCQKLKPEYGQASLTLKDEVALVAVDCTTNPTLCTRYRADAYPTCKFISQKLQKPKALGLGGQTASQIVELVRKALAGPSAPVGWEENGSVVHLTDDTFDEARRSTTPLLVFFYAPWCGHCKAAKPDFAKASLELEGKAVLAAIDCTEYQDVCGRWGAQAYPTIKLFLNKRATAYEGARTTSAFVEFVLSKVAAN